MTEPLDWIVIGAGPSGIAAIGSLLDHKVAPGRIGWIDLAFQVGDLGGKWQNVPSNTKVGLFLKFLHGCKAFEYEQRTKPFPIEHLNPNDHCFLKEIVAPLQWITNRLAAKVKTVRDEAIALNQKKSGWEVKTKSTSVWAKNVILATGAEPKQLSYPHLAIIPLETALDPTKLAKVIQPNDIVGVFGSSHSAVLVLANLMQLAPRGVYNFYRSPHLYAVELDDWILFDNTGLKGFAAQWAREHLDGVTSSILKRCLVSDVAFQEVLDLCTKIVCAVGFEKRSLPIIEQFPNAQYQETIGVIAPGLFGIGIAYPQAHLDPLGNRELRVGLWKFMDYLNTAVPIWLKMRTPY